MSHISKRSQRILDYLRRRDESERAAEWAGVYHVAFCVVYRAAHRCPDPVASALADFARSPYALKLQRARDQRAEYLAQCEEPQRKPVRSVERLRAAIAN